MRETGCRPMPLGMALFYFGIPAAVVIFIVYFVMPFLAARNVHIFFNYLLVYATVPMLALIAASIIAYRREGNAMSWPEFKNRFRLNRMDCKSWLWTIGLTVFMILSAGLLSFTARWLASFSFLAPPDYWPAELNPNGTGGLTSGALPTDSAHLVPTRGTRGAAGTAGGARRRGVARGTTRAAGAGQGSKRTAPCTQQA